MCIFLYFIRRKSIKSLGIVVVVVVGDVVVGVGKRLGAGREEGEGS